MNPEPVDPRVARTRRALIDATADLLVSDDGELSVTAIVGRAGLSRPTFYQHFGDIPTLVRAVGIDRLRGAFVRSDASATADDLTTTVQQTLHTLVLQLHADHVLFRRVLHGSASHGVSTAVTDLVIERMRDRGVAGGLGGEQIVSDGRTALAAGLTALMIRWLDTDFTGENAPEQMAQRLVDVTLALAGLRTS